MAAMMVVMVVFMVMRPHHGFITSHDVNAAQAQPTYTQMNQAGRGKAASAPQAASPASSEPAE